MSVTSDRPIGFTPQPYGFTTAALDDFGLDVYAFRAYHAIARRAGADNVCWESVPNIAKRCRMSERRLQTALRHLESVGLIHAERRDLQTTLYTTAMPGVVHQVHQGVVHEVHQGGAPGAPKGLPLKDSQNEEQKTSSAEPTDPPERDIEKLVALWNEHCGELAKTRVVSREVEAKLRALRKRHGEALDQLFLDGIAAVTHDPFWLGKKSPERDRRNRREGPPYGLVNYLRHMEDKANLVAEERAEEGDAVFPRDFAVGQSWWTREHGAIVVVGVASDRKQSKVRIVRAKDGGPEVGATALIGPADLKTQRHVDVTV